MESNIRFGGKLDHKQKEKEKQTFNINDLESIKKYIEEIRKSSNPIGRMIDLLPEDIESMNKELQSWIKDSKSYKDQFEESIK